MFYMLNYNSPHESLGLNESRRFDKQKIGLKKRSKKVLDEIVVRVIYYKSRR